MTTASLSTQAGALWPAGRADDLLWLNWSSDADSAAKPHLQALTHKAAAEALAT